jgi:hypothetical protein
MPFKPPLMSAIVKLPRQLCMGSYSTVGLESRMTSDRLEAKAMMHVKEGHVTAR